MNADELCWAFVALLILLAFACPGDADWHKPTLAERRAAHWNLPRWARGDYPQENEPRKPNRAFGLDW